MPSHITLLQFLKLGNCELCVLEMWLARNHMEYMIRSTKAILSLHNCIGSGTVYMRKCCYVIYAGHEMEGMSV